MLSTQRPELLGDRLRSFIWNPNKKPQHVQPPSSEQDEHRPLLPSDRIHFAEHSASSAAASARKQTKRFLTSKTGHYAVLLLVALDISCIFGDLLITSLACEGHIPEKDAEKAGEVLGIVSLVFSCLFMVELLASIWSFGLAFFKSYFHCFDAIVIVTGLIIDILLRGTLEEIGSIVVVLRLWRVLKIIDELSAGAAEQMEPLSARIEDLEKQNKELQEEVKSLRRKSQRAKDVVMQQSVLPGSSNS
ncbi:Voltage-gated hydrogen channel 1 [Pseudocercospora fuligena]|uniref:Voltage-gated hydrogen channel 1 n=1 Tax=Pseudocercospora fuligena TaxID=685502 RepID=A0A8H6RE36_9PEZI|nr:Voltage-gated hydrogen channel 1 [Pseudocercospora fuligena]